MFMLKLVLFCLVDSKVSEPCEKCTYTKYTLDSVFQFWAWLLKLAFCTGWVS